MFKVIKLSILELLMLIFTATLLICGVVIAHIDVVWYEEVYVVEDGFVENWTVVPLLIATVFSIVHLRKSWRYSTGRFKLVWLLIPCFSFFVAGEEMSWGQRIFQIESSDFFRQNNAQGETNLHNMVVGTTKVNKLIFSQLLSVVIGSYLLVLPYFYQRNEHVRTKIDQWGIPVPQFYQTLSCLVLFISIIWIPSGKNAEILEAGITSLFLLILLFPANRHIYKPKLP